MRHLRFTEERMDDVEEEIARRMTPHQEDVDRLCTIPGVDRVTAWGLLAEIGFHMDQFPSAAHLASWAGLGPGNFESAGKRLSGKTRKGSASLRRCLSQAAWAASATKNNYLAAFYRRLAARRGAKRAIVGRRPSVAGDRLLPAQAQRTISGTRPQPLRQHQRRPCPSFLGKTLGAPRPRGHATACRPVSVVYFRRSRA